MLRLLLQYVAGIVVLVLGTTNLTAQERGDKVMTIVENSRISIVGAKEPLDAEMGAIFVVREVRGEQLEIETSLGIGVIPTRNVLPLDRAEMFLSDEIKKKPRDALSLMRRARLYAELGEQDKAISDCTSAIKLNPRYAFAYFQRGNAYSAKGDHDRAFDDFSSTIQYDPKFGAAYLNRGHIWKRRGDRSKQMADYNQAVLLDPKSALAYYSRGQAFDDAGDAKKAVADYKQAIKINPQFGAALNNVAWLQATHSDSAVRNGKEAVDYATKLCDVEGWDQPGNLDTLAAAYAEAGDFANAVKWQSKAVELAPAAEKADYQARVTLYQSKRPFRDSAK